MSFKRRFFKPKWQHKDPEQRARAVATSDDPELLAGLNGICLQDTEAMVRLAAARRIVDLATLQKALLQASGEEASYLQGRVRSLTCSQAANRPDLALRLEIVKSTNDRDLLEQASRQSPDAELRCAAVQRITRQGVLGDIAVQDTDHSVRKAAVERIDKHSTLNRVQQALRKTDKALYHEIQSRIHNEKLASGDETALREDALHICEALEQIVIARLSFDHPKVTELQKQWAQLPRPIPDDLNSRYEADLERVRHPAPLVSTPEPTPVQETVSKPKTEEVVIATAPSKPASDPGADRKAEAARKKEQRLAEQAILLQQLEVRIDSLQELLDTGDLHQAIAERKEIIEVGTSLKGNRDWQNLQGRLGRMQGRMRELRDWHHWSNNKIRKRLITEMDVLPSAGLHPDAVLARIKELQAQWKELQESEQIPGEKHFPAPAALWRAFNTSGQTAFEATKPFLDKRTEVQSKHLEQVMKTRERLVELLEQENFDLAKIRSASSEVSKAMRSMSELPTRERKKVFGKLKKTHEQAKAAIQGHYESIEKIKLKLVREAAQLSHVVEREEAIATAKRLQQEWKQAGSLWRSREQELWEQFREPIDPLFAELKEKHEAQKAQTREKLEEQKALYEELREITRLENDELIELQGKVTGLNDQWLQIRSPDRKLNQLFTDCLNEFSQKASVHRQQLAEQQREVQWQWSDEVHELEAMAAKGSLDSKALESKRAQWAALVDNKPQDSALKRLDELVEAAPETDPDRMEKVRLLCIQLEFLAGLESPPAESDQRMKYQVDRLSQSLAGTAEQLSAREEADQAEQTWLDTGYLPDPDYGQFRERIRTAIREIEKE